MKQYNYSSRLMLVGKAWEIRHQLRTIARQGRHPGQLTSAPLTEYLNRGQAGTPRA